MTLPLLRKLGNRLRSCLTLMLLAIIELCAWRPLRAEVSRRNASDCAGPEALPHQEPGIAHNWQPTVSAANGGTSHAHPQSTQTIRRVCDSLLAHGRDGPSTQISSRGARYCTGPTGMRLAVRCRSPQAAR